jgi:hypothetical protein
LVVANERKALLFKACIAESGNDATLLKKCEINPKYKFDKTFSIAYKYKCYAKYGIPNEEIDCSEDASIHLNEVTLSNEVVLSPTSHVTTGYCYHTTGKL